MEKPLLTAILESPVMPKIESSHFEVRQFSLWTRLLQFFDIRSKCCGAKIFTWSGHKHHCEECDKRLD